MASRDANDLTTTLHFSTHDDGVVGRHVVYAICMTNRVAPFWPIQDVFCKWHRQQSNNASSDPFLSRIDDAGRH